MWVRGHWRLLQVVPFESLGTVSYSPSIVTMTVCLAISEIFNVKEWRDLENHVWTRSRSLIMVPFNRPYTTVYWMAIITIALAPISSYLTLNNILTLKSGYIHTYYTVTLKYRLRVTQGHWKQNHWIDHTRLSSSWVLWRLILLWFWNVG